MFFLKKVKPVKNKLPEKLVELKNAIEPSWVWDTEYRLIVWSNNAGLKFWNVDTREEVKELIFPENNSMVVTCDNVAKKLSRGKVISEVITFPIHPNLTKLRCDLSKQELPDGRYGVLITVRSPIAFQSSRDYASLGHGAEYNGLTPQEIHIPTNNNKGQALDNKDIKNTMLNQSQEEVSFSNFDNKSSTHDIMLVKPATLTCDRHGLIISTNEITASVLNIKEGDNCRDLFVQSDIAADIVKRALCNAKLSFVQKVDIGHGLRTYLLQTNQFKLYDEPHFNMGILAISQEKYQDFLANDSSNAVSKDTPLQSDRKKSSDANDKYLSSSLIGDMTGIGLFNVTKNGIVKAVNQTASILVGMTPDTLIGKSIIEMFGVDATNVLRELIINNNHAVLSDLENGVRCQYDDIHRIEHIAKLIVRPNHADNGFWFILNDVTELESIKNELSDLKHSQHDNMPKVINDSKDIKMSSNSHIPQFVNAVSHEIRAPLNAIAGYAEMIETEIFGALPDIRYKDFAQSIRGAGEYALSIINELLDYSKLKAGGFVAQFSPVDIDKIASEVIDIVYPQANARKIEIVKTILTGTPLINSDARLLKQVLINLLTNAIKYSHDNDQILLTAGLTKTGRVMFEVTDFGRGMTKQEIHDALMPFNRVNQQNDIPGTGLGLCLAKELTELTHGRFMIDSIPSEKTRVRIIYEKDSLLND